MAEKILVFLEQRNGQIKKASLEVLKLAYDISVKLNAEIEAATVGSNIEMLEDAGNYGVKKIAHFRNEKLGYYAPNDYSKLIADYTDKNNFTYLLLSNTSLGKDLAPRVAVKLDAGIAVDCTEVSVIDSELHLTRPVYAGKILCEIRLTSQRKVITFRPNIFKAEKVSDDNAEIILNEIAEVSTNNKVVEVKTSENKLDVTEADIIVSGGRGLKEAENFGMIEELAKVLGAAQGASRAVVDAGWRPHSEQVGQTGKTVSPSLYIAIGISGAIQHLAGMRSSKYIVAINKDKDAPIFQIADYGIAGDAFEIVPALIEEIKKIKSN